MKEKINHGQERAPGADETKFRSGRISVIVIAALVLEIILFSLFTKYFS